jgi:hypothetical protein
VETIQMGDLNEPTKNKSVYLPEYSGPIMLTKMTDKNGNPAPPGIMAYATCPAYGMKRSSQNQRRGELHFI